MVAAGEAVGALELMAGPADAIEQEATADGAGVGGGHWTGSPDHKPPLGSPLEWAILMTSRDRS